MSEQVIGVAQPVQPTKMGFGYEGRDRDNDGPGLGGYVIGTAAGAGAGAGAGAIAALVKSRNGTNEPLGTQITEAVKNPQTLNDLVKEIEDKYVNPKADAKDAAKIDAAEIRTVKKALSPVKQAQKLLEEAKDAGAEKIAEAQKNAKKLAEDAAKIMKEGTKPIGKFAAYGAGIAGVLALGAMLFTGGSKRSES